MGCDEDLEDAGCLANVFPPHPAPRSPNRPSGPRAANRWLLVQLTGPLHSAHAAGRQQEATSMGTHRGHALIAYSPLPMAVSGTPDCSKTLIRKVSRPQARGNLHRRVRPMTGGQGLKEETLPPVQPCLTGSPPKHLTPSVTEAKRLTLKEVTWLPLDSQESCTGPDAGFLRFKGMINTPHFLYPAMPRTRILHFKAAKPNLSVFISLYCRRLCMREEKAEPATLPAYRPCKWLACLPSCAQICCNYPGRWEPCPKQRKSSQVTSDDILACSAQYIPNPSLYLSGVTPEHPTAIANNVPDSFG